MLYSHSGPLLVDDQKMAREYLGADRLMFGADYPFVDQDVLLDILQKAVIRMPNWTTFSGKTPNGSLQPHYCKCMFSEVQNQKSCSKTPKRGFLFADAVEVDRSSISSAVERPSC